MVVILVVQPLEFFFFVVVFSRFNYPRIGAAQRDGIIRSM